MRFAVKEYKGIAKVIPDIQRVSSGGWCVVTASSRPPYGPFIEKRKAAVYYGGTTLLEDVRVIALDVDAQLLDLESRIKELQKQHRHLLNENFLTFALARIVDFDPAIVKQGMTKAEAQASLPTGKEARECTERGKELAKMAGELNPILRMATK